MLRHMSLDEAQRRKLKAAFRMSGILQRHSVLADYATTAGQFSFYPQNQKLSPFPQTAIRSKSFGKYALPLALKAIENAGIESNELKACTHLITVSCTGMYAPGLDIALIKALSLDTTLERTCINFMGCYAAFNGLKVARNIINSDECAQVLIVCLEMCSLHFQQKANDDNILANTLFGDGGAAVWMSAKNKAFGLKVKSAYCNLLLDGENDMAWHLGDYGFEMKLTSYIPQLLEKGINNLSKELFYKLGLSKSPDFFAIHPGGKKILQSMQKALQLNEEDIRFSSRVLAENGNMSSPTILFVLKEIMEEISLEKKPKSIVALAFGPGLTLESMLFETNQTTL